MAAGLSTKSASATKRFKLESDFTPKGDQPAAIVALTAGLKAGQPRQVLLGATGTGKTFTVANVVANYQRPTLVLAHNKTLAAQLYSEFKTFFPNNAIHYFVSYFDYYQPEAYKPQTDTYVEKDSAINDEIARLRHGATNALLTRSDVLIVASVSCIFGLGSVDNYQQLAERLTVGQKLVLNKLLARLTLIQYQRNQTNLVRGTFRLKGDILDLQPADEEAIYRLELDGDRLDRIRRRDLLGTQSWTELSQLTIFPASHYVTNASRLKQAIKQIKQELGHRLDRLNRDNDILAAHRLQQRVEHDLEMLQTTGFVKGIENYSLYLSNRRPGQAPATLLDYFPDDYLLLIDESHITLPQVRGMYNGDRRRKQTLVDYGFRLPSALDNRPLNFAEFTRRLNQVIYISATPGQYELDSCPDRVEQVIRPTYLLDPEVSVRPIEGQIDDLIAEVKDRLKDQQRVLITTLTKKMAEDLTDYLKKLSIKVQYLHSDIDTLSRSDIIYDLRRGRYDVLVGINLLREGLDLPEVSLVIILDADREGFLRSESALIQTIGRAARHQQGQVIMYADQITDSMKRAITETNRRRQLQAAYNHQHSFKPRSVTKSVSEQLPKAGDFITKSKHRLYTNLKTIPIGEIKAVIDQLQTKMELKAANLDFEAAANLRDSIILLQSRLEDKS